jgi:DNA-binding winged helix-turn-helix (wHTH) protein
MMLQQLQASYEWTWGIRAMAPSNSVRLRFEAFELDEANARLLHNGRAVPLAPKPFALLCELVRRQGALCTKQTLLDKVWGHQFVSDSVLKTAISDLRTVLGDDSRKPRFIETAARRGYRFVAPVTTISARRPASSVARSNWQDCAAPGILPAVAGVLWFGSSANRASARRP